MVSRLCGRPCERLRPRMTLSRSDCCHSVLSSVRMLQVHHKRRGRTKQPIRILGSVSVRCLCECFASLSLREKPQRRKVTMIPRSRNGDCTSESHHGADPNCSGLALPLQHFANCQRPRPGFRSPSILCWNPGRGGMKMCNGAT